MLDHLEHLVELLYVDVDEIPVLNDPGGLCIRLEFFLHGVNGRHGPSARFIITD